MITRLLRRIVAASAGALVLVGTSAGIASAAPASWNDPKVTGLALVNEIVLIPLAIAAAIALIVWTFLTAKERAANKQ